MYDFSTEDQLCDTLIGHSSYSNECLVSFPRPVKKRYFLDKMKEINVQRRTRKKKKPLLLETSNF